MNRGKKCCIVCGTSDPSVSYFNFPTKEDKRNEWLHLFNLTWEIPKSATVCAKHFVPESFTKDVNAFQHRRRLKRNAVPSQYLEPICGENNESLNNEDKESNTSELPYCWCLICGSVKDSQRSFHRFPKEIDEQSVWLSKCGQGYQPLTGSRNHFRLCSLHFSADSFIENKRTKRRYLKRGAVPIDVNDIGCASQNTPNNDITVESTEECEFSYVEVVGSTFQNNLNDHLQVGRHEESMTVVPVPTDFTKNIVTVMQMETETDVGEIPSNMNLSLEDHCNSVEIQSQNTSAYVPIRTLDKETQTEEDLMRCVVVEEFTEHNTQPSVKLTPIMSSNLKDVLKHHSYFSAGALKSVRRPRYVGDISTPHLATPRRAKKCLAMAKDVIDKKNITIASLARKLRFAQEKLKTMEELIIHLRDTKYLRKTPSTEILVACNQFLEKNRNR